MLEGVGEWENGLKVLEVGSLAPTWMYYIHDCITTYYIHVGACITTYYIRNIIVLIDFKIDERD
jgi:hypothetical protein